MREKITYFVRIHDTDRSEVCGIGECALFRGLSADDTADYEKRLSEVCQNPCGELPAMSSIRFGFETAMADLRNGGIRKVCDSPWLSEGRPEGRPFSCACCLKAALLRSTDLSGWATVRQWSSALKKR